MLSIFNEINSELGKNPQHNFIYFFVAKNNTKREKPSFFKKLTFNYSLIFKFGAFFILF